MTPRLDPDELTEIARSVLITAIRGLEIEVDFYELDAEAQNDLLAEVLYAAVGFIGDIGGRVVKLWEEDRAQ